MTFWDVLYPRLLTGAEIYIAVFVMLRHCDGRSQAWRRFVGALSVGAALSVLFAVLAFFVPVAETAWDVLYYVCISLIAVGSAAFVYHVSPFGVLYLSSIGLALRFLAVELGQTVCSTLAINGLEATFWQQYLIRLIFFAVSFVGAYFLFVRRFENDVKQDIDVSAVWHFTAFLLTSVVLLVCERLVFHIGLEYGPMEFCLVAYICGVLYALSVVFAGYVFFDRQQNKRQLSALKALWTEDRKHYETQKENIEAIQIKAHDLHHQLENAKQGKALGESAVRSIEKSLHAYDSLVETGNEVLDVILSNTYSRCLTSEIQFTCIVDGGALSFMDEMDLYSLFGNILENAYEYESTVQPAENRFISLTVKKQLGVISVHEENYFTGNLVLEDGLAQSTKRDKANHGFGMRSMRKIVSRYGGQMTVSCADGMFQLDVLLPESENSAKGGGV